MLHFNLSQSRNYLNSCKLKVRLLIVIMLGVLTSLHAQLRQIHKEVDRDNSLEKISFYNATEGYVAFDKYIGFTTDSGYTFTPKYILTNNVNYNGNSVNITFGFTIYGIKALNRNNIIVYGGYAKVPAILYSSDGGNTYKLVFHSQLLPVPDGGITDMIFPSDGMIGYAIDPHRLLKTIDGGLSWTVCQTNTTAHFSNLQVVNDNQVFAYSYGYTPALLYSSANGGSSWQQLALPASGLNSVFFYSPVKGWLNAGGITYTTVNGGNTWQQTNDIPVGFDAVKLQVINDSTAYAINGTDLYKTTNTGKIWERFYHDNTLSGTESLGLYDFQLLGSNLWTGGSYGLIELSTNSGGSTIPKAIFTIDETKVNASGQVNLVNQSRSGYQYTWLRNGKPIANTYNTSYSPDIYAANDTIQLITQNGKYADTAVHVTQFSKGISISSFSPNTANTGTTVTIYGNNFADITGITFGGAPAKAFKVLSPFAIEATVGNGATGNIVVTGAKSKGSKSGFVYIPPPVITSFSPQLAGYSTTVTIIGQGFTNVREVSVGGTAQSFTVISSTEIRAVVNRYSASGDVSVTNDNGKGSLPGFHFLPAVTGTSQSSGSYGVGFTLSGSGFYEVTAVTIDDMPVQSFTAGYGNSEQTLYIVPGEGTTGVIKLITPYTAVIYNGYKYYNAPKITSFSPMSGPPGTNVTIVGSNFSDVAAENIVYFGGERAVVTSASANSITVAAPLGATYQPICVIAHKTMAFSNIPFMLTYSGGNGITTSTFGGKVVVSVGNNSNGWVIADLNNDNKPDLISGKIGFAGDIAEIYRNGSSAENITFPPFELKYSSEAGDGAFNAAVVDWDMDGKLDIVLPGIYDYIPGINIATAININRDPSNYYAGFTNNITKIGYEHAFSNYDARVPLSVAINDMDIDGRPDIVICQKLGMFPNAVLGDMNNDGKPDVLVRKDNNLLIYLNTSTKGSITYAPPVAYDAGDIINNITIGDFDNDGKLEIALAVGSVSGSVLFLKNSGNNINLTKVYNISVPGSPVDAATADVDGDGKIDFVVVTNNTVTVFKNTLTAGTLSFTKGVDFDVPKVQRVALGDLDGDGKPDLACLLDGFDCWILRNMNTSSTITSFTPGAGKTGTVIEITGTNLGSTTSLTIGGVSVKSFTVNSPTSITAIAGDGATGYLTAITPAGAVNSLTPFTFLPVPVIAADGPTTFSYGGSVMLSVSPLNGLYNYQWYLNGQVIQGATQSTYKAMNTGAYTVGISYAGIATTSAPIDINVLFYFPVNNYQIDVTSATCKGSANGAINIRAIQSYSYTVTIIGNSVNKSYDFNYNTSIKDLAAGVYNVCFTLTGSTGNYKQCFTVVITEPKDLSVYTAINKQNNSVALSLDGGDTYHVTLNGTTTTTNNSSVTLNLVNGINHLSVTTEKACQGIITKEIDIANGLIAYPNPFTTTLNVNLGDDILQKVLIELYDLNGVKVFNQQYYKTSGIVQLNVAQLSDGLYMVKVSSDNGSIKMYKVLKK